MLYSEELIESLYNQESEMLLKNKEYLKVLLSEDYSSTPALAELLDFLKTTTLSWHALLSEEDASKCYTIEGVLDIFEQIICQDHVIIYYELPYDCPKFTLHDIPPEGSKGIKSTSEFIDKAKEYEKRVQALEAMFYTKRK